MTVHGPITAREHRGVPYGVEWIDQGNGSHVYIARLGGARNWGPLTVKRHDRNVAETIVRRHIDSLCAARLTL